jgi:hypothetical protein
MSYPTWPFTRLTPQQMAALEKAMQQKRRDALGEALL